MRGWIREAAYENVSKVKLMSSQERENLGLTLFLTCPWGTPNYSNTHAEWSSYLGWRWFSYCRNYSVWSYRITYI